MCVTLLTDFTAGFLDIFLKENKQSEPADIHFAYSHETFLLMYGVDPIDGPVGKRE
jgi:hypothetical protein